MTPTTTATTTSDTLAEAVEAALEALEALATEIRRAGARESVNPAVARFAAYHLADIEGNDGGAGWLASGLLADELRALMGPRCSACHELIAEHPDRDCGE